MEKILIIEDDELLNDGLCFHLQKRGYKPVPAYNASQAASLAADTNWSLFILDINLPDGSGLALARKIRQTSKTPIIFLTARDLDEDIIQGFDAGADDYITKPFNVKIFMQRIQAVLRRCVQQDIVKTTLFSGNLEINLETMEVKKNNDLLPLTPTEFRLLYIFCQNPGQILTRQVLLEKLWDIEGNFVDGHTLTINISRLRKKIEDSSGTYIKTVYGMGYQWMKKTTQR